MAEQDSQGRAGPPVAGDETATLVGFLDRQRAIFAWKCGGLDAAGLRATAARLVDDPGRAAQAPGPRRGRLFLPGLLGRDLGPPWDTVDWDADPDWEWRSAADGLPRAALRALAGRRGPLPPAGRRGAGRRRPGPAARWASARGESPSLRRILIDMIEEYARHVGHADLIRESVDGLTGEDPPD